MLLPCQTQMIQLNLVFKAMLLPRASAERQNTPHPTALAVNKSLAVFISKYVLSDCYKENCRGSVNRLGSKMPVYKVWKYLK